MPTVKLYSQLMNPFTEKVACALALKGVEYQRFEVSDSEEIKRLSPAEQTLPVLDIDGERVSKSSTILLRLEELYPEPSLFASDPKVRRQQESLAEWSDTNFAFYWNRWRLANEERERREASASPGILSRIHQHVEERIGIESDERPENTAEMQNIMQALANRLDDLVGFLGNRPYFFSTQLSVADLGVFGMLLVMRDGPMLGSAELLAGRPALAEHTARLTKLTRQGRGG